MRRNAWWLVLLLAGSLSGCRLDWPMLRHEAPKPPAKPVVKPAPPPVTADQVTEANVQAKAQALEEEIARDEQGSQAAPGRGPRPR